MAPEKIEQNTWFGVAEAAKVLGISRQAVYRAINSGQIPAKDIGLGKKIRVQDLLGYGIQTGKDPNALISRIQEGTGADAQDLLIWVLAGLGLVILIKALLNKK